ncbi:hypothetical protein ChUKH1_04420 [Cryptosporidium hominis]|uniref:EGF-like domain-containing protein n=1 Tax=Cryptosporidium hominis TaxID=237895 RepID=A0ABX5BBM1_CRYHO|nr:hypothetical protein ChTU502y2012_407g1740 [Cryptosporidium hominis]PPA64020.1 hypothetical protein ChUKH1_04420 [Cryptosporidium hominis]PPS93911.1 Uncharacterized protein GY17_00003075 [Cryptosporidium hominis]|eukprot:PPS93911.1 Uncharacterized protein GY17_00003075 [Cryptosporidium hominis]
MRIVLFAFLIVHFILRTFAAKSCEELTSNAFVLSYCKNGSKCTIDNIGGEGINNQLNCECLVGYSLSDCSLQIPETDDKDDNTTKNTCWIQDLLQLNQEFNNFSIFKHIFQ